MVTTQALHIQFVIERGSGLIERIFKVLNAFGK
jgi:hypothetical protein